MNAKLPSRRVLLILLPAAFFACAPQQQYVPSTGSTFSAASSYSAPSSPYNPLGVASGAAAPGEVVVRPEQVLQAFAIRSKEGAAKEHFEALKGAVAQLESRLKEATGGAASVVLIGMRLEQRGGKARTGGLSAVVDGEMLLTFPPDATVWDRARALFGMQELAALLAEEGLVGEKDSEEEKKKHEKIDFSFGVPNPQVLNPDRFRAELTQQWTARVKAFIQSAQSAGAPLAVVDCRPPAEVRQRSISIERVALSLEPTCRVDLASGGAAPVGGRQ